MKGFCVPTVVVDNASSDETRKVITAAAVHMEIIQAYEPKIGLSHARNMALRLCSTDYLVFLDDDAEALPSWIAAINDGVRQWNPDFFGGPYTPLYLRQKPSWLGDSLVSAHTELEEGPVPRWTCFSGGNMGWRTALLRRLGGFSPILGMRGDALRLGEETQLQFKLYSSMSQVRAVFLRRMAMLHYVPPYKMKVLYWWRRSWAYGWNLIEIAPNDPLARMSLWHVVRDTRGGLPLLLRIVFRDREKYPKWRSFAVAYGARAWIMYGALARRLFSV
jgi:glycosyltransferase involved in cell wall biosynthesis